MKHVLTLTFVILSVIVFAQDEETTRELPEVDENFQKYLDDGLNTGANGDLKIAVSALVSGFLDVQYEQKITDNFAIQAGGAFQVSEGNDLLNTITDVTYEEPYDIFKSGFGYGVTAKYYAGESAITNLGYGGFTFRHRTSKYEGVTLKQNDIYYTTGLKYLFMNSLSADLSSGIGVRIYNMDYANAQNEGNLGFYYGLELKLGYYIKY